MERILNKLDEKLSMNEEEKKEETEQDDDEQLDPEIGSAINDLGNESDSDVQILHPKKRMPAIEEEETPEAKCENFDLNLSFEDTTNNSKKQPSPPMNNYYQPFPTQKTTTTQSHEFIDYLTRSPEEVPEKDAQEITLAFYDPVLAPHVAPYFDSLLATRKGYQEIAQSLGWFVRCLKNRNNH